MKYLEYKLQKQISQYLRLQYPDVFFLSDTIANLKLTIPQKARNKAIQCQSFKCPDLLILEPRNGYSGLFIELKTETPFKKNGEIKKNDHLIGQYESILKLNEKGYKALFCWDFDECIRVIDEYLNI